MCVIMVIYLPIYMLYVITGVRRIQQSSIQATVNENSSVTTKATEETRQIEKNDTVQLVKILSKQIRQMQNHSNEHDETASIKEQWEKVAQFLEFVFFWFFSTVIVILSILLLVIVPMLAPHESIQEYSERFLRTVAVNYL